MTDSDELIIETFKEKSNELMKFISEKGDPFSGFILLFYTMVHLSKNFEQPFFKEKISSLNLDESTYFNLKILIKGILALNNKINREDD